MLIIDGDLYVYKAGFALKGKEVGFKIVDKTSGDVIADWGSISLTQAKENINQLEGDKSQYKLIYYNDPFPLDWTLERLDQMLYDLLNRFPDHDYKMFITSSDHTNYRFSVAKITPYKGSRRRCIKCFGKCYSEFAKDGIQLFCKTCGEVCQDTTFADKPTYYKEIRDHLVNNWGAIDIYGEEADDAVSYTYTQLRNKNAIMVHIDKDIDNTPGEHYNPDTDKRYSISKRQAMKNFYSQMLIGDRIDCIPGVPGVGKILAERLLEDLSNETEYENRIMDIFQGLYSIKKFKNTMNLSIDEAYERLKEIGLLLWIRREEGELWKPTISI